MKVDFYKYQGTGNDFVIIDDRKEVFPQNNIALIAQACDRRFGIGADGLILLREKKGYDFEMVYFNADGRPSSMCGNGGRCIAAFARFLGICEKETHFLAVDGPHDAIFDGERVSLLMKDVDNIIPKATAYVLNTGSPHFVMFAEAIDSMNIMKLAKAIRYSPEYAEEGINVNFVEVLGENKIKVRTYERGVEDETFSCGTGVVASAIAYFHQFSSADAKKGKKAIVDIETKGGSLSVAFTFEKAMTYSEIWLQGPAEQVFVGNIII